MTFCVQEVGINQAREDHSNKHLELTFASWTVPGPSMGMVFSDRHFPDFLDLRQMALSYAQRNPSSHVALSVQLMLAIFRPGFECRMVLKAPMVPGDHHRHEPRLFPKQ